MKTLCNFVSLPLRSWAVRAGQHLAKTWTTARRRQIIWNLVEKLETLHLVTDKLDCEDICFLVLAGNHSWGSHPFLLYHRPCVTWRGGGCAEPGRWVQILFVLLYRSREEVGSWKKSLMHKTSGLVSQNIVSPHCPIVSRCNSCRRGHKSKQYMFKQTVTDVHENTAITPSNGKV